MGIYFQIENLFWVGFAAAAAALIFAGVQLRRVLKLPEEAVLGDLVRAVRKGTLAFLKRQCLVSVPLFLLALLGVFGLYLLDLPGEPYLPLAFLSGGACAAVVSLAALILSIFVNARAATAVEGGVHSAFNAAFTAGSAAAFLGVGLGLLEVTAWFFVLRYYAGYGPQQTVNTLVLFGAGAAYAALLSRLGGSIFAKAADLSAGPPVGAESEVREVHRGPGAVADCAGDNVVSAAAAADLCGGYVLALLAALCAAVWAFENDGLLWNALLFPMAVAAVGVLCSLAAAALVKAGENTGERPLLTLLWKGAWVGAFLTGAVCAPISYLLTGSWGPCLAVGIGLLAGRAVEYLSVRSSSNLFHPVRRLAGVAESGVSAELSGGAGVGLCSASELILLLVLALVCAFLATGGQLDTAYENLYANALAHGLYGVALAGLGLLSTLAYSLSAVLVAPLADNADCAVKVAGLDKAILGRAAVLNSLGGSLACVGRALAVCGGFFVLPVLLWVYTGFAKLRAGGLSFAVTGPALLAGAFMGVVLLALFLWLLLSGVQSCVQPMAAELRRQFREVNRLGDKADPDYTTCVDLCARSAALRTLPPSLLALAAPPVTALLLGPEGTAGLLWALALLGLPGALFLSGAGSALDCARRRLELERRGSAEGRRCAVICDMVGDLFKDVAGPSLGLLVRFSLTAALLLSSLAVNCNLLSLPG